MPNQEYYPSPPESPPDIYTPDNNINNYGITPIMSFIMNRNEDHQSSQLLDKFLRESGDINAQNDDGDTSLHLACRYGRVKIAERLITNIQADLTITNNTGLTALHVAVCANQLHLVRIILDNCNRDIIDMKSDCIVGDTALIMAVKNNSIEAVKLLIEFKANVNEVDNSGLSALHYCAKVKVNNYQSAEILILNGAIIDAKDHVDEKTPISLALSELGALETADVLIKYNTNVRNVYSSEYEKKRQILEETNLMIADNRSSSIESHKRKFSDTTETGKTRTKRPRNKHIGKETAISQVNSRAINQPPPIYGYANYSYYNEPNAVQYEYDYYAFQHQQPTTTETFAAYF